MRILIHGIAMRKQGGGSRHLRGFISALGQLDRENEYLLYLNAGSPFESSFADIRVYPVEIHSQLHRLWWDQIIMPRLVHEQQIGLILAIFVFGCFRPPVPQIVFQRNSVYFCQNYLRTLCPLSRQSLAIRVRRQMARWTMQASQSIVVPSNAMRQMILRYCPEIPPERFSVIPHAFDLKHFCSGSALSATLQAKLEMAPPQTIRLLYVSHLEPHKDIATAIEVARLLTEAGEDFRLYLTMDRRDDPNAYDALQMRIRKTGLSERVINLGRVPEEEVYHLYQQCDIFLFPSLCESFGFPMKEALAMGLPIVAADTPINREMCGEAAYYFPPRDAKAAAWAVSKLIHDKGLREQMSDLARRQFATTTLDWHTYAKAILSLISRTIGGAYGR